MLVSKINFTSNFDNFSLKQPVAAKPVNEQISPATDKSIKRKNLKKYSLIGAGLLLAGLLIFKGKSILNKFRKAKNNLETIIPPEPETPPLRPPVPHGPNNPPGSSDSGRYALIDTYERITQARAAFKKRTAGRSLTPEEKIESEHLRQAWSEVYHSLVPEHQSIIRTKTAAEFSSNAERKDYIMKYVLPRMNVSEESALDGLDMFEQFGFRAEYPNGINTTITKLAENMYTLPKESKSDKVLNRFIDVFGKFGNNVPSKHPDDEELCFVLTDFAAKGHDIKEETFLRGIQLLKKIASQKWCAESLDDALISSYDAKFKESQSLIDALNDLKLAVSDLKYRLEADDRC
ncbi:MAG: hypothetical protein NC191_07115 [Muribaculaceae bacterium]|nr:hypothetical protein [Muribaculaceae bacterium]